jgi:hypothetical protein
MFNANPSNPFTEITDEESYVPNYEGRDELKRGPFCFGPTVCTSVTVFNRTTSRIASYDRMGFCTVLKNDIDQDHGKEHVVVEYRIRTSDGTTIPVSAISYLTQCMPDAVAESLKEQIRARTVPSRPEAGKELVIRWSIPLSKLLNNPEGVRVNPLGLVLRMVPFDRSEWHISQWHPADDPKSAVKDMPDDGLKGYLNIVDPHVHGAWINLGGSNIMRLCQNYNDPARPQEFIVWRHGVPENIPINQMGERGFFTQAKFASTAHTANAAAQKAAWTEFNEAQAKINAKAGAGPAPISSLDEEMKKEKVTQEKIKSRDASWKSIKDAVLACFDFLRLAMGVLEHTRSLKK